MEEEEEHAAGKVTYEQYLAVRNEERMDEPSRFCNENLDNFKIHTHTFKMKKGRTICAVCGKGGVYWRCEVCHDYMHWNDPGEKKQTMITCSAELVWLIITMNHSLGLQDVMLHWLEKRRRIGNFLQMKRNKVIMNIFVH